jgi:Golgi nucleoside diphosphatase
MHRDDSLIATRARIITIWCHIAISGSAVVVYTWLMSGSITRDRR